MTSHILLYSDNAPVGGVYQYNHSLLCKLATSSFQVSSVQLEHSNQLVDYQKELGVEQYWISSDFMSGYSRSYTDIETPLDIFSKTRPDLIVFSDGWPMGNFAAKQAALQLDIPYIIVVGFVDPNCAKVERDDGISYTDAAGYHYSRAREVIAVSQENLGLLHTLFKLHSSHGKVIHYGRPPEFFTPAEPSTRQRLREELNIPNDGVMCFTSARLAHVKGYDLQLQALEKLKSLLVWEKLYFVWAGCGIKGESVEQEIKQRTEEIGVDARVKFLGERRDIPDLLGASDMYILPSRAEGMPLAIMEAMAKGIPVIASAVSGIPEELGDTGTLLPDPKVDPEGTISTLVSTIEAWGNNSNLRHQVGAACKQRADRMFTEERMLSQYLDLIHHVLQATNVDAQVWLNRSLLTEQDGHNIEKRIDYACFVWSAWNSYRKGNLVTMKQALLNSLPKTPFLPTETILNWIESFTRFSQQDGHRLLAYELCQSEEWRTLVAGLR